MPPEESDFQYDVAISFAGEDRSIAREVANGLGSSGVKVFFDEFEDANLWGKDLYDYLTDIYQNQARFCIILVSHHYAQKVWPNRERQAAQARALGAGQEYILPVRLDDTELPGLLPTISYLDLRRLTVQDVIERTRQKLSSQGREPGSKTNAEPEIHLPRLKKATTQRDIDLYLHEFFRFLVKYFEMGLKRLDASNPAIDVAFQKINELSFTCVVYYEGDIGNKCKIWIGGISANQVSYVEGSSLDLTSDNTYNDWLTVDSDGYELGLRPSGIGLGLSGFESDSLMSKEKAAEYLWKRFCLPLER